MGRIVGVIVSSGEKSSVLVSFVVFEMLRGV